MTSSLLFLTYTPRPDSGERGYEDWLRSVDNPFFNAQPGIAHYTNWKFGRSAGEHPPFSHFDFMLLESGSFPADIFGSKAVLDFVAGWTQLWGAKPEGAPEDNCQCCLASLQGSVLEDWGPSIEFGLDVSMPAGETWRVEADIIGRASFQAFSRRSWSGDAAIPTLRADRIAGPPLPASSLGNRDVLERVEA